MIAEMFTENLGDDIYLRIEAVNPSTASVLADPIESNNFTYLLTLLGLSLPVDGPSMILFLNYPYKKREGVVYSIDRKLIELFSTSGRIRVLEDSLIIALEVNVQGIEADIFGKAVSYSTLSRRNPFLYFFDLLPYGPSGGNITLPSSGKTEVIVKNVGQGSWNEIIVNDGLKVIFDAGTHYSTKATQVHSMFAGNDQRYQEQKPCLIISHWDVDHYHFLKTMHDATIQKLAFIICRSFAPSLTSRAILSRLMQHNSNCILIQPDNRQATIRETPLFEYYNNNRFIIFNSGSSRNRNKDGISILVRNSASSILLPGDQHYSQLNHSILTQYLNYRHTHSLVVPHHGGHAGKYQYNLFHQVKKGSAVISVGKNSYGHPFSKIINSLSGDRFHIKRTDIHNDVTIAL
jgi:beta-lactamase superfamily II metal-dependent hydrolase